MFGSLDISTSGLRAQRAVVNVISQNIANAYTTRDAEGNPNPYRRKEVLLAPGNPSMGLPNAGVSVADIREDMTTAFEMRYNPNHPDAIKEGEHKGYVYYPNVNMVYEMTDLIAATRAYEANVTAMEAAKGMMESSLRLLA